MSNCFIYAVGRWLREGGCIVVHRSKWGWWPHMLWTKDNEIFWEFIPPDGTRMDVWCPPPVFRGQVHEKHKPLDAPCW